uniref:hypothetical protein n=1 Tax=Cupriavidus taiwanensis TaxID=164546 RepID=UPI003F491B5F
MMSPLSFVQTLRHGRRAYLALTKVDKPSIESLADDKANAMAVCGALAKCWIRGGSRLREPIPVLTRVIVTVARKRGWTRSPPGSAPDT